MSAAAMLIAAAIDARTGWPDAIHSRIGHPVTWIGALVSALDARLNRADLPEAARRRNGIITVALVLFATGGGTAIVVAALPGGWAGTVLTGILAWPLLSVRSMYTHVMAVSDPLRAGDETAARRAVAMIVGRDPSRLDTRGIARAALESLAENTSDGIVAPLFWGVIGGLPGIALYKAVNTMDSMIGHRTARHEAFGRAAARLDDVANWVPARATGAIFALVSARPGPAFAAMRDDARAHRSPNAGWPEAAMAGALGVRLSGPRIYADRIADEPWINGGAPDPDAGTLERGLALYRRAMVFLAVALAALALA